MVGGTNGKGSTCAFLESIYHSASISKLLVTHRRIFLNSMRGVRINKAACSDEVIVDALFKVNKARKDIPLTYFEMTTLAAILIFVKRRH